MPTALSERLDVTVSIARKAGDLAQRLRRDGLEVSEKGAQDFVTQADRAVETLIRAELAKTFPEDGILGEEDGMVEGGDGMWVIDPIDGTTNYATGSDYWCVSIAWVHTGRIKIGVVFAPDRDEMFAAAAGQGATLNGKLLAMIKDKAASRSLVCVGRSPKTKPADHAKLIVSLLENGFEYRRYGAGALCTVHVAAGYIQAFCEQRINSWDILAGLLIVVEAGGWGSDFLANDGLTKGNPVIACVDGLHTNLKRVLEMESLEALPK